jgi:hypothetical protein
VVSGIAVLLVSGSDMSCSPCNVNLSASLMFGSNTCESVFICSCDLDISCCNRAGNSSPGVRGLGGDTAFSGFLVSLGICRIERNCVRWFASDSRKLTVELLVAGCGSFRFFCKRLGEEEVRFVVWWLVFPFIENPPDT